LVTPRSGGFLPGALVATLAHLFGGDVINNALILT
jgi:hypothetical protein